MAPGITDITALFFYFIFWSAFAWMLELDFAYGLHLVSFSLLHIVLAGVCASYLTVYMSKKGN